MGEIVESDRRLSMVTLGKLFLRVAYSKKKVCQDCLGSRLDKQKTQDAEDFLFQLL